MSAEISKCRHLIKDLNERGSEVDFQWIPGHGALHGNDVADRLAKLESQIMQQRRPFQLDSAKKICQEHFAPVIAGRGICMKSRWKEMRGSGGLW